MNLTEQEQEMDTVGALYWQNGSEQEGLPLQTICMPM